MKISDARSKGGLRIAVKSVLLTLLLVSLVGCIHPHHGRRGVAVQF